MTVTELEPFDESNFNKIRANENLRKPKNHEIIHITLNQESMNHLMNMDRKDQQKKVSSNLSKVETLSMTARGSHVQKEMATSPYKSKLSFELQGVKLRSSFNEQMEIPSKITSPINNSTLNQLLPEYMNKNQGVSVMRVEEFVSSRGVTRSNIDDNNTELLKPDTLNKTLIVAPSI